MSAPTYAVFDIDGVLADVRHRLHHVQSKPKDWDAFFDAAVFDKVLDQGKTAVEREAGIGRTIVYVTGRPEGCRGDTVEWLERHGFPHGQVHMRGLNDRRPAKQVKPELVRRLLRSGDVAVIYDDDKAVIVALRQALTHTDVVHVTWMDEPSAQATLFDAQELEGRT